MPNKHYGNSDTRTNIQVKEGETDYEELWNLEAANKPVGHKIPKIKELSSDNLGRKSDKKIYSTKELKNKDMEKVITYSTQIKTETDTEPEFNWPGRMTFAESNTVAEDETLNEKMRNRLFTISSELESALNKSSDIDTLEDIGSKNGKINSESSERRKSDENMYSTKELKNEDMKEINTYSTQIKTETETGPEFNWPGRMTFAESNTVAKDEILNEKMRNRLFTISSELESALNKSSDIDMLEEIGSKNGKINSESSEKVEDEKELLKNAFQAATLENLDARIEELEEDVLGSTTTTNEYLQKIEQTASNREKDVILEENNRMKELEISSDLIAISSSFPEISQHKSIPENALTVKQEDKYSKQISLVSNAKIKTIKEEYISTTETENEDYDQEVTNYGINRLTKSPEFEELEKNLETEVSLLAEVIEESKTEMGKNEIETEVEKNMKMFPSKTKIDQNGNIDVSEDGRNLNELENKKIKAYDHDTNHKTVNELLNNELEAENFKQTEESETLNAANIQIVSEKPDHVHKSKSSTFSSEYDVTPEQDILLDKNYDVYNEKKIIKTEKDSHQTFAKKKKIPTSKNTKGTTKIIVVKGDKINRKPAVEKYDDKEMIHLPNHQESSTLCEQCDETEEADEEKKVNKSSLSKKNTKVGEKNIKGTTNPIAVEGKNNNRKPPVEKYDDIEMIHLPNHQKSSTVCEICDDTEEEENKLKKTSVGKEKSKVRGKYIKETTKIIVIGEENKMIPDVEQKASSISEKIKVRGKDIIVEENYKGDLEESTIKEKPFVNKSKDQQTITNKQTTSEIQKKLNKKVHKEKHTKQTLGYKELKEVTSLQEVSNEEENTQEYEKVHSTDYKHVKKLKESNFPENVSAHKTSVLEHENGNVLMTEKTIFTTLETEEKLSKEEITEKHTKHTTVQKNTKEKITEKINSFQESTNEELQTTEHQKIYTTHHKNIDELQKTNLPESAQESSKSKEEIGKEEPIEKYSENMSSEKKIEERITEEVTSIEESTDENYTTKYKKMHTTHHKDSSQLEETTLPEIAPKHETGVLKHENDIVYSTHETEDKISKDEVEEKHIKYTTENEEHKELNTEEITTNEEDHNAKHKKMHTTRYKNVDELEETTLHEHKTDALEPEQTVFTISETLEEIGKEEAEEMDTKHTAGNEENKDKMTEHEHKPQVLDHKKVFTSKPEEEIKEEKHTEHSTGDEESKKKSTVEFTSLQENADEETKKHKKIHSTHHEIIDEFKETTLHGHITDFQEHEKILSSFSEFDEEKTVKNGEKEKQTAENEEIKERITEKITSLQKITIEEGHIKEHKIIHTTHHKNVAEIEKSTFHEHETDVLKHEKFSTLKPEEEEEINKENIEEKITEEVTSLQETVDEKHTKEDKNIHSTHYEIVDEFKKNTSPEDKIDVQENEEILYKSSESDEEVTGKNEEKEKQTAENEENEEMFTKNVASLEKIHTTHHKNVAKLEETTLHEHKTDVLKHEKSSTLKPEEEEEEINKENTEEKITEEITNLQETIDKKQTKEDKNVDEFEKTTSREDKTDVQENEEVLSTPLETDEEETGQKKEGEKQTAENKQNEERFTEKVAELEEATVHEHETDVLKHEKSSTSEPEEEEKINKKKTEKKITGEVTSLQENADEKQTEEHENIHTTHSKNIDEFRETTSLEDNTNVHENEEVLSTPLETNEEKTDVHENEEVLSKLSKTDIEKTNKEEKEKQTPENEERFTTKVASLEKIHTTHHKNTTFHEHETDILKQVRSSTLEPEEEDEINKEKTDKKITEEITSLQETVDEKQTKEDKNIHKTHSKKFDEFEKTSSHEDKTDVQKNEEILSTPSETDEEVTDKKEEKEKQTAENEENEERFTETVPSLEKFYTTHHEIVAELENTTLQEQKTDVLEHVNFETKEEISHEEKEHTHSKHTTKNEDNDDAIAEKVTSLQESTDKEGHTKEHTKTYTTYQENVDELDESTLNEHKTDNLEYEQFLSRVLESSEQIDQEESEENKTKPTDDENENKEKITSEKSEHVTSSKVGVTVKTQTEENKENDMHPAVEEYDEKEMIHLPNHQDISTICELCKEEGETKAEKSSIQTGHTREEEKEIFVDHNKQETTETETVESEEIATVLEHTRSEKHKHKTASDEDKNLLTTLEGTVPEDEEDTKTEELSTPRTGHTREEEKDTFVDQNKQETTETETVESEDIATIPEKTHTEKHKHRTASDENENLLTTLEWTVPKEEEEETKTEKLSIRTGHTREEEKDNFVDQNQQETTETETVGSEETATTTEKTHSEKHKTASDEIENLLTTLEGTVSEEEEETKTEKSSRRTGHTREEEKDTFVDQNQQETTETETVGSEETATTTEKTHSEKYKTASDEIENLLTTLEGTVSEEEEETKTEKSSRRTGHTKEEEKDIFVDQNKQETTEAQTVEREESATILEKTHSEKHKHKTEMSSDENEKLLTTLEETVTDELLLVTKSQISRKTASQLQHSTSSNKEDHSTKRHKKVPKCFILFVGNNRKDLEQLNGSRWVPADLQENESNKLFLNNSGEDIFLVENSSIGDLEEETTKLNKHESEWINESEIESISNVTMEINLTEKQELDTVTEPESSEKSDKAHSKQKTKTGRFEKENTFKNSSELKTLEIITENSTDTSQNSDDVTKELECVKSQLSGIPPNYEQNGCNEKDFEHNKNCFCIVDDVIKKLRKDILHVKKSSIIDIKCTKFLKVLDGLVIGKHSVAVRRKKRSYLFEKHHKAKKRETIQYNKIKSILAEEVDLINTDSLIYAPLWSTVNVPCLRKEQLMEHHHYIKYVWSRENGTEIPILGRLTESPEGILTISNVTTSDGGNYTCTINAKFINTDLANKQYFREIVVIAVPIFRVKSTIFYDTRNKCSLKDGDIVYNYLPEILSQLLCGFKEKMCTVEMQRPSCISEGSIEYLNVTYITTMDFINHIVPNIKSTNCDFHCQMKIYSLLSNILVKDMETVTLLPVFSNITQNDHHYKSRVKSIKTIVNNTNDYSLLPILIIGCPPGFGIRKSQNKLCVVCPKNTYSDDGGSYCHQCLSGFYQPSIGSTNCLECTSPLEDKACLSMLYSNAGFYVVYVGTVFGIVVLLLLLVFCVSSVRPVPMITNERKEKRKHNYIPRKKHLKKDIEDSLEDQPLLKPQDKRADPPKLPPPDF